MIRRVILMGFLVGLSFSMTSAVYAKGHSVRTCRACGQKITGPYVKAHGFFYHPGCFTCAYCGQPMTGSYVEYQGKNYHEFCFRSHVGLRCAVCRELIHGQYFLDYWGNAYHKYHQGKVPQCDFCKRFIVGSLIKGMVHYSDGRYLCGLCAPEAITKTRDANRIMYDVSDKLDKRGIHVDPRNIEIALVGENELAKLSGDKRETTGFVDYAAEKSIFGRIKKKTITIYLLYGMPKTQVIASLAHELMHVWQFERGRLKGDRALSEGSCNYASYLVLKTLSGKEPEFIIDYMMKDEDPVYGGGFRSVRRYVETKGINNWLGLLAEKDAVLPAASF